MTIQLRPYQEAGFPKSKKEAEIIGAMHFISSNPCKRGHIGLRYTKGATCIECIKLTKKRTEKTRGRSIKNIELSRVATSNNQTTYIPEKPCKFGHNIRFVASNNCVKCDELMRQKHKLTQRYCRIKKEYGLTKEQYLELVKQQNSYCKLCNTFSKDHFKLHIDHCHETNQVRGLLCGKCNQGIGLLNHDVELIRKAALYCEAI